MPLVEFKVIMVLLSITESLTFTIHFPVTRKLQIYFLSLRKDKTITILKCLPTMYYELSLMSEDYY